MSEPAVLLNFIDGRWRQALAAGHVDVYNPARGVVIARTPLSTRKEVDVAVKAAAGAHPGWSETPPVIRTRQGERVLGCVERGVTEGAKLVVDGRKRTLPSGGFFVGSSVFDQVAPSMSTGREEIFGPVAAVSPVTDKVTISRWF